jgi:hypothetical protein
MDVLDMESDRMAVGLKLDAEGIRLHDRNRQGPRLELAGGHAPPALRARQAEHGAVELVRLCEVARGNGNEVDAGDLHRADQAYARNNVRAA